MSDKGALTLERKEGEGIVLTLGETQVEISVTLANYGKCKLRVEAPEEVKILRKELLMENE